MGFDINRTTTDQIFLHSSDTREKWDYNATVHQLFLDFKKAYNSIRRKVLYNTVTEFGVPMKLG
jgi:hypothetical protein